MILASIGVVFLIFIINMVPAFMPPTWILVSFVAFSFHLNNYGLAALAIFAAIASASGRAVLALISDRWIRNKVLSEKAVKNIDFLKQYIEKKKTFTSGFFLFFAFSPFPSGQLFLAYGLTHLKIRIAAVPFFFGRLASYLFWAFTASEVSERVNVTAFKSGAFFSVYFILGQLLTFYLVYLFVKIDWKKLLEERKLKLVKQVIE